MNGESGKSSPCVSSDGPDSLDALPEDLFKQDSIQCAESSCSMEASGIEQRAISGLDVALSEDFSDKQNGSSECFDSASESNCMQSELAPAEGQDTLLTSDLDALPDGGFDDIVAMDAEGDSQFEQTMAMLRDLSGSEVCPAIVSCVDDNPGEVESTAKMATKLNDNFNQTSANDCIVNDINLNDISSFGASTLSANESKVGSFQTNQLAGRKPKASSGFFNRCIENLLQRGRETAATRADAGDSPQNWSRDSLAPPPVPSTSVRSHRKSRKPIKVSQIRLSEDVVITSAKAPLPLRCNSCTFTCNSSSELTSHSAICGVDTTQSEKVSGFTCTYCKIFCSVLEDFRKHLSRHVGHHSVHCFFCHYCDYHSNSMDRMDDHITLQHLTEPSRYEVSLEKVAYLQNMIECPVCGGSYLWKSEFVRHCRSDHHLEDLATYLESSFLDSPTPKSFKVSRQLFESFADILQTDSAAEDGISTETRAESNHHDAGSVKRFQCDQCSFSADNWELWDRHVQECHEPAADNFLQNEDDWSNSAPLVIDEDNGLPDVSTNSLPESKPEKMLPTGISSGSLYPDQTSQQETENNLELSSRSMSNSLKTESDENLFPPGMEPVLIPVNPASGEVPQLMKIGSGRKGVKLRCRLCPFECYRTPNFRRHLAIHVHQAEYPESYQCAYCKFQHRRLNCIRFHLGKYHSQLPAKLSRVVRGKVVEVICADDINLPAAKYSHALPNPVPVIPSSHPPGPLPIAAKDYVVNKKEEVGSAATPCRAISVDDLSKSGCFYSRERRMCKPPKRLSDSTDFQPPSTIMSNWKIRRMASAIDSGNMAMNQSKGQSGRPFNDNIAEDYIQSDLPPGMIYPEPIKCPQCSFTNRVRINLVRHIRQHHAEDLQQAHSRAAVVSSAATSLGTPSWLQNVPAWARPSSSSQTIPSTTHPVTRNDPMKPHRDTGAAAFTTSYRYLLPKPTPKLAPKLPNRLGALSGASGGFTHGYMTSGHLAWSDQIIGRPKDRPDPAKDRPDLPVEGKMEVVGGGGEFMMGRMGILSVRGDSSSKRLFKCAYCSVSSRWNRRDISLHVLHVHVRRRAFRCRRCGYGTSKSASTVTVHCARTHPGRPAIIEDNLTVLNAILPLHTRPGTVLVAFRRPSGVPIMNLDELEEYFGLSKLTTDDSVESASQKVSIQIPDHPEDSMIQYSGASPLDLTKDHAAGISQPSAVFPTPYLDVFSQDTIHKHYPGTFGSSQRTRSTGDSSERNLQLADSSATVSATVGATVSSNSHDDFLSATRDAMSTLSSGGKPQQLATASPPNS